MRMALGLFRTTKTDKGILRCVYRYQVWDELRGILSDSACIIWCKLSGISLNHLMILRLVVMMSIMYFTFPVLVCFGDSIASAIMSVTCSTLKFIAP